MMSAPLLVSCDLRTISDEDFEIITNEQLISINQRPSLEQAYLKSKSEGMWIYSKEISEGFWVELHFNTTQKQKYDPDWWDKKRMLAPHAAGVHFLRTMGDR